MIEIMIKIENQNFCLIMKDNYTISNLPRILRNRVKIFNRINAETVKSLINSCVCAIST
jgi:hypothetical protein